MKEKALDMLRSEVPFDAIELMEWAEDNNWSPERLIAACQEIIVLELGVEAFMKRMREYGVLIDV